MQPGPVSAFRIRMLGGFEICYGEQPIALTGQKIQALTACLALPPGKAWPRERLMALLWGDRGDDQARASLRQALARLRRVLGPLSLRSVQDTIMLEPTSVSVDAVEFEKLAKDGDLAAAAELYCGDLLDALSTHNEGFAEWLLVERVRLHDLAVDVLSRLTHAKEGASAIECALRLLKIEPAREETHRMLMRLYVNYGRRDQALRQYQLCRGALEREVGAKPDVETERLYIRIRDAKGSASDSAMPTLPTTMVVSENQKPSIAVLPFANMSGDPGQQYFSDGTTEDIITELARFGELSVSARNASFVYRDRAVAPQQIGRDLGVKYALEGSVRKLGGRLRVTAQLIDTATGTHIWAERYDRKMAAIFDIQDEIASSIVETLSGQIASAGIAQTKRMPPSSWRAYDYYLMGSELYLPARTRDSLTRAIELFEQAIRIDPHYSLAYSRLAACHTVIANCFVKGDREAWTKAVVSARDAVKKAMSLDSTDANALLAFGWICLQNRNFGEGQRAIEHAHFLNPHNGDIAMSCVTCLSYVGEPDRAAALAEAMIRRNPRHPEYYLWDLAEAYFFARRHDNAVAIFDRISDAQLSENRGVVVAAYAHANQIERARMHAKRYVEEIYACWIGDPNAGVPVLLEWEFQYRHVYKRYGDIEHLRYGLSIAGLPV